MIEVIQPGLYTTIQDQGRFGYYGVGFPPSGSMDQFSASVANILVGNSLGAPVVETTFVGPTLMFTSDTLIAVTGADAMVTLDGESVELWTAVPVAAGQTLAFGGITAGARNYLAVNGGLDGQSIMGSASTYVASRLGGIEGRTLEAGDRIGVSQAFATHSTKSGVALPVADRPKFRPQQNIRIVEGLCHYLLSEESRVALTSNPFTVSTEANRIGYRLTGEALSFIEREQPFGAGSDPSNVVNLGYPVGSLQSPSGSEIICLMRDAVTGGGYATLATVISADLDLLSQMKYPEEVAFESVSLQQALEARATRQQRLAEIRDSISR